LLVSAQRYADPEPNLRKAVDLTIKSIKANSPLGLLLTRMGRRKKPPPGS
jgi:hypothetical protein